MTRTIPVLGLTILLANAAGSAEPPQSIAAKNAKSEFETALKKLDEDYQKKAAALRDEYRTSLDAARKEALARNDLDEAQRIVAEQKDLTDDAGTGGFQVISAWHGAYASWRDVTAQARKQVKNGELKVAKAGDLAAGLPDPAFGHAKSVVVVYRSKGGIRVTLVGDDKALNIPVR